MSVIKLEDFDVSKLIYSERTSIRKHSLENYYISYDAPQRWPRVQFPWMLHPFDTMNDRFSRGDGAKNMLLSFDPADPKHQACIQKVREVDDAVLAKVRESGWVQPGYEIDWLPALKQKGDKYFNIKFKLPRVGEEREYLTTVTDGAGGEVSLEEGLTERCKVQVLGRPARVYVRKGQVGVLWEAIMMRTKPGESVAKVEFIEDAE